jgi:UDP-N-acetylglucosamine 2-epimerase (non-hydrolysing)
MLDQVLDIAGIVPDHDLDLMRPDQSLDALTAALLTELGQAMDAERPDWVVVQGDTATAMTGAIAAYYRKIPVAHIEAGLRSGNIHHPWPEEVNRKIIGTIAALHCAPTETSAAALRRENVDPATIHVTGNTVIDALHWITARIGDRPDLAGGLAEFERRFAGKRIVGVTSHRRENFGQGMEAIAEAIRRLAARDDVAIVFPVHLNPNVRAVMNERLGGLANVALIDPLDYPHFARLLDIATLMLTDSGGVQEEAPALGKPVLVMRETTERPEGVEAGTAKLVGTDANRIVAEAERLLDDPAAYAAMARAHNPFGDGHSAGRIVELLAAS